MIETRHLFDMSVAVGPPQQAATPSGLLMTVVAQDGTVRGERLNGRVIQGGGDWLVVDTAGIGHVDVRLTIELDDGPLVAMRYLGRLVFLGDAASRLLDGEALAESDLYFRTAPQFTVESGPFEWLNGIQAVAIGSLEPGFVHYRVHELL